MKRKISIYLSFVAGICFLVSFLLHMDFIHFILGWIWICIGILNYINLEDDK